MIDEQDPALKRLLEDSFQFPPTASSSPSWVVWRKVGMSHYNGVLQDWVVTLPRRFQGALVVALRGCDLTRKPFFSHERSPERELVAHLRFLTMNPADPHEIDVAGALFRSELPVDWKASEFGHFPEHWYSHVMHAYEVVGYEHPSRSLREPAREVYEQFVHNLHLRPESRRDMWRRLLEDRLAANTVVS